ncbi:hypothetical protein HRR83_003204 [Exophiala dermatitidis]|uniref:Peroxin 20 n=1 Tax=Exophiala dermatitidis TaxID=5970 RepID=A0AAN6EWY7_EXODE|nr:hypothetical protein HRR75_004241 [Exophiala dermatitidis]KAJ4518345.1 hypothetical protein HRR74_004640 [Exophiala dermatitidis]KAJ4521243.1 hypothetical protein HRR73_003584 [Exophiala dermatitidis]KAJ4547835.1 hypothetical protein HRR76_000458 [Exophiala dermatitidis]KAJ4553773.1 hypothetical protein HRR77_002147 [Exophiala dermatitidis]
MADALCGPANPLQNLQKHSQVDRTLQQDRLVGHRQSPNQGFRTSDPRAGAVDADFHAFENAAPSPFQFQHPQPQQQGPVFHPQGPVAGWAADFKRLSLTEPQSHSQSPIPMPAGQFRAEAPLVRSTTLGGWQNEFVRQRSSPVAQGKQAVRDPGPILDSFGGQSASSMMMGGNYNYSQQSMYQSHMAGVGVYGGTLSDQQQQGYAVSGASMTMEQQHAQLSDVDYEAAFAEVIAHAQEMDQQQQTQQPASIDQLESQQLQQPESEQPIKIGSDAIQYRDQKADSQKSPEEDRRDADELARTAGLLLNSVQHDTSSKFQNSQFLDLMRRIRDREIEVQNNDLQTVGGSHSNSQTLHNTQQQQQTHQPYTTQQDQDLTSHFQFPDMDAVYAPDVAAHDTDPQYQHPLHRSPFTTYGFDDDINIAMQPQQNQTGDALHPGGKWYPDQQSPRPGAARVEELSMSGAIPSGGDGIIDDGAGLERMVSASEFGHVDETAGLARRFVPGDAWAGAAAGDAEMGA